MRIFHITAALALAAIGSAYAAEDNQTVLPPYQATGKVVGVVRIRGDKLLTNLLRLWEAGFMSVQPDIRFRDDLYTNEAGMQGLAAGVADVVLLSRKISPREADAMRQTCDCEPLRVSLAATTPGEPRGVIIFVSKDNPLMRVSIKQMHEIFAAREDLGTPGAPVRGSQDAMRNWGQLGLTGAWAYQPIHVTGIDATNDGLAHLTQAVTADAGRRDRLVIGVAAGVAPDRLAPLKALAIRAGDAGPYVSPSRRNIQDGRYPLTSELAIYLHRRAGKPLPFQVKQFVRYLLSREGQAAIASDGVYAPLSASAAGEQLRKLD